MMNVCRAVNAQYCCRFPCAQMVQRHAANAPPVSGRAAHWQSGRSGKIMGKHGGGGRCGAPRTINQPRRS